MKLKTIIYQFLFPALIAGIGTFSISCSNDNGNSEIPDVPTDPTVKPFVGVTYMEDSVKIQLQLLNSDSIAMDTFEEGEDIIFKLTVINISNEWVEITPTDKFSDNIFNVYSSSGKDMGKPWDGRLIALESILIPRMMLEHICSWLEEPLGDIENMDLEKSGLVTPGRMPVRYFKNECRQPLPKGNYYTQFDISIIEGKATTIRMDFKIE